MQYVIFDDGVHQEYDIAILHKESSLNKTKLIKHYVDGIKFRLGLRTKVIAFGLPYHPNGKYTAAEKRTYLAELLVSLKQLKVTKLYVTDPEYFKVLTGVKKTTYSYCYVLDNTLKGYEETVSVLGVNYDALFFNPTLVNRLNRTLTTLAKGNLDYNIIHNAEFPDTVAKMSAAILKLHKYDKLTCDIETKSLKYYEAGIATIAFAWDKHNGIALCLRDLYSEDDYVLAKKMLLKFFTSYKGTLIFHNANYDVKVLIYELFIKGCNLYQKFPINRQQAIIDGLKTFSKVEDTKLLTYLAVNSTSRNNLKLKDNAHEFAGDYGEDVKDISKITTPNLLIYNLKDCLCTWYLYEKYKPIVIKDNQLSIYNEIFIPSIPVILQMELTGMPLSKLSVQNASKQLHAVRDTFWNNITISPQVVKFESLTKMKMLIFKQSTLKKKIITIDDIDYVFNPHSSKQLTELLYDTLKLPILARTKKGFPSTKGKVLKQLINTLEEDTHKDLLTSIVGLTDVTKIISTFIQSFYADTCYHSNADWLTGSFNLGGAVSGRLSSSGP